jgi:hypothetical protein
MREHGARVSKQKIASWYGVLVPKCSGCGWHPATQGHVVDHIVVQQQGNIGHLHNLHKRCALMRVNPVDESV